MGVLSPLAYISVLYAMKMAPLSYVAPVRELSMLLGVLVGARLLREGYTFTRMVGTALVVSTVATVAFTLVLNGPTILQNVRKVPAEVLATFDQYLSWVKEDEHWEGDWSTFPEGIVNMEDMKLSENTDLKISLTAKNGVISGEISTGEICRNVPIFDFLLLRGKVSGNSARVMVWDIIDGKTIEFGELDLIREGGVIKTKPISGNTKWFPAGARIGKHPTREEIFLSNFCRGKRKAPR